MAVIEVKNLSFGWLPNQPVLDIPNLSVSAGEKIFLVGGSGSGKSTLLGLIAGVFAGHTGTLNVFDQCIADLSAAKRDKLRADHMGVIFQQFNLVPYLSPLENVLLTARFSKQRRGRMGAAGAVQRATALDMLHQLGLPDDAVTDRKATSLSVGQQQRVAAARALVGGPELIIADEPTSALDSDSRDQFIEALLHHASDATVIFVSHDERLAHHFDRTIDMRHINHSLAAKAA